MKALLLLGLIGGALVSAQASAAVYGDQCQSCTGGASSGASWFAKVVAVAQTYGATVGDVVVLCKNLNGGSTLLAKYNVTHAPVVNSGDVAWFHSEGFVDVNCADLGF